MRSVLRPLVTMEDKSISDLFLFVKLGHADSISHETIRRVLKKTNSSLG